jgi:hypothetical protein
MRTKNSVFQRRSVFFHTGGGGLPKPFTDYYVSMFIDDVSKRIVPLSRSGRQIELKDGDTGSEHLISEAVNSRGYGGSFESTVSEFLRLATAEMLAYGRAVYEIAYHENPQTGKREDFIFLFIDTRQIKRWLGRYYQIVPNDPLLKLTAAQIHLPKEDLLILTLPPHLERELRQMKKALTRLSDMRLTAAGYELSQTIPNYDFKDHERSLNLALAQSCEFPSWEARGTFRSETTEYLSMYRRMKWNLFLIEIREVVLERFNEVLNRLRKSVPFEGHVSLINPPTKRALVTVLRDLEDGKELIEARETGPD